MNNDEIKIQIIDNNDNVLGTATSEINITDDINKFHPGIDAVAELSNILLSEINKYKHYDFIKNEMRDRYNIDLTYDQIEEYLQVDPTANEVFDTLERESFVNYIGKKVTGMDWPMNGDSEDYKDMFMTKFFEKCKEFGYIIQ